MTPTQEELDDARIEDTVHCSRCKAAWDVCETYSVDGDTKSVCVECIQDVIREREAEIGRLRGAVAKAVELAKDLDRWADGWCPESRCCAKSVAPIADRAKAFAREFAALQPPESPDAG